MHGKSVSPRHQAYQLMSHCKAFQQEWDNAMMLSGEHGWVGKLERQRRQAWGQVGPKTGGQKAGDLHVGKMKPSTGKTQNKRTDQVRGRAVQSKLGVSWVPSQLPLGYICAACCSFFDHSIASCDCNNSTDPSASYFRACCHSQLN